VVNDDDSEIEDDADVMSTSRCSSNSFLEGSVPDIVNVGLVVADNWENDSMSLFSWGSDGYDYHDDHSFGTTTSSDTTLDLLDDVTVTSTRNQEEEALEDDVAGPDLFDLHVALMHVKPTTDHKKIARALEDTELIGFLVGMCS
jgi:hypothetical protein